jgi:fructokinase
VTPTDLILVAGEALVDLVPRADGSLAPLPGGGPFNTARTLGRLERPVAYLGRLSTDRFGEQMADALTEDGVRLDAALRTGDPTTLALVELDARGSARYRFYTEGTSAPGLTEADALAAPEFAMLHVGTLALVLEPIASALEALACKKGVRAGGTVSCMLDPNVRPSAIPDEAAYRARLDRMLAVTDVVKVSDEDLAYLVPGAAPEDAARSLLEKGPHVILLTRGAEGAVALGAFGERRVAAPRVQVVDTIGAGDAFSGGFLAKWQPGGDLADGDLVEAATAFACTVAAMTCAKAGAEPPRLAEFIPG